MTPSPYFPDIKDAFITVLDELQDKQVVVIGHVRPDGDCIGSQVGMVRLLRSRGIDAIAVNQHPVPKNMQGFIGDTPFFLPTEEQLKGRVVVTTDCAGFTRMGLELSPKVARAFLNVDHHISNELFAEHNFVVGDASATAEVLAGLAFELGLTIDATTAQALYLGIATDTGQFRFPSTTGRVFEICCRLIEAGANPATAAAALYENESFAKIELLQRFLASLRFECEGRACIGQLTQAMWDSTGASREDAEGLVDYARAIEGVEIGVLLEERDGHVKGSLRCKNPEHRVDQIAALFNGGGHACAAGFNPGCSLEELRPRLVGALEQHFETLQSAHN